MIIDNFELIRNVVVDGRETHYKSFLFVGFKSRVFKILFSENGHLGFFPPQVLGIEPRILNILGKCYTTEVYPSPGRLF
jgi:hypothetical protein